MKLIVIFTVMVLISSADAGILGERCIEVVVGETFPGDEDVKDIDKYISFLGAGFCLPATENLDFVVTIGRNKLEGREKGDIYDYEYDCYYHYWVWAEGKATSFSGSLQYQFSPRKKINPFLSIGVVRVKSESESIVEIEGYSIRYSEEDSDTGFLLKEGLEFNITEESSINMEVFYRSKIFDEYDTGINLGYNFWLTSQVLLSIGGGYCFNSENGSISMGFGIGF